jgi:hydroxymethylbilane synthase
VVVGIGESRLASAMATELLRRMGRVHPHLVFRRRIIAGGSGGSSGGRGGARNGHVMVASPRTDRHVDVTRIEKALLDGDIDLTVGPIKDMPGQVPPGLALTAVLARTDARDALCGSSLRALPHQARVGTSGLRRRAQILALRPDVLPFRLNGPITSQLQQLRRMPPLDAVVLPVAGLARLGLAGTINESLAVDEFPPAPGQGALGVITRSADASTSPGSGARTRADAELREQLAAVHDPVTAAAVAAERSLRAGLHEGCGFPIGGHARIDGDQLRIIGQVTAPDGRRCARRHAAGPVADAAAIGRQLAADLLDGGAGQILAAIRPGDRW